MRSKYTAVTTFRSMHIERLLIHFVRILPHGDVVARQAVVVVASESAPRGTRRRRSIT